MATIILSGRLGRDAELRQTANGRQFLSFSMAEDVRENKDTKRTDWYSVSTTQTQYLGDFAKYLTKGKPIQVIGDIKTSIYTRRDGGVDIDRNIRAFQINFIDFGRREDEQQQGTSLTGTVTPQAATPAQQPAAFPPAAPFAPVAPVEQQYASAEPEDDLPF